MSSWKAWRKRRYGPVIREHEKELPAWRVRSRVLFERFMNYPNSKLAGIAAFGFVGVILTYIQGLKWTQRKLYRAPYTVLALEKFRAQKKLVSLVGEPLKPGHILPSEKGSIQDNYVDLLIPIEGSKSDGVLLLEAHKVADSWVMDDLSFEFVDEAGGVIQIIKNES